MISPYIVPTTVALVGTATLAYDAYTSYRGLKVLAQRHNDFTAAREATGPLTKEDYFSITNTLLNLPKTAYSAEPEFLQKWYLSVSKARRDFVQQFPFLATASKEFNIAVTGLAYLGMRCLASRLTSRMAPWPLKSTLIAAIALAAINTLQMTGAIFLEKCHEQALTKLANQAFLVHFNRKELFMADVTPDIEIERLKFIYDPTSRNNTLALCQKLVTRE